MKRTHHDHTLWIVTALTVFWAAVPIGLCHIQPVGRKAGLIQFDAVAEQNEEEGTINRLAFARYWVCADFYAVSIVWDEPPVITPIRSLAILSDRTGLRMDDGLLHELVPVNTTYPKPLDDRGPLALWSEFMYAKARFAEVEAASRRVYASDLGPATTPKGDIDRVIDIKVAPGPDGVKRKVTQLKVHTTGDCIDTLESFDGQRKPLGRMKYEYQRDGSVPRLTRLTADWPERPEELAVDVDATTSSGGEMIRVKKTVSTPYVSHKGGRTAVVTYSDVALGDTVLRMPVQVEVRRTSDKRLLRSVRLTNFKRVDMNEAAVWEAAKAFGAHTSEDQAWDDLARKYHPSRPTVPLQVDPNDIAFVERMAAKYPVPEMASPPPDVAPRDRFRYLTDRKKQEERNKPRMQIDSHDAELIRKQIEQFRAMRMYRTPEERAVFYTQGWFYEQRAPSESERQVQELRSKLIRILGYHHAPPPPEEKPGAVEPNDLRLVRQLQSHYEKLAAQDDRGLGGQLKALDTLVRLDDFAQDYTALNGHAARYLQTLQDGRFVLMYTMRGYDMIKTFAKAHQYDKANRLMTPWADFSAAHNDADAIFRFVNQPTSYAAASWANVLLLDRLLKKSGLSPLERYEALALRAIALDTIDKLLANPEVSEQAQWILSGTTKPAISKTVEPAVRQAVAAWESLGPARNNAAKPYSTAQVRPSPLVDSRDIPRAMRLQETSAQLNRIAQQRLTPQGTNPRSGAVPPSAGRR